MFIIIFYYLLLLSVYMCTLYFVRPSIERGEGWGARGHHEENTVSPLNNEKSNRARFSVMHDKCRDGKGHCRWEEREGEHCPRGRVPVI